jgi:hypothetical protein
VPEQPSLEEGQYSLIVEGGIVPMHPMSCVRHHHLRLTFEAAFEFGRDEEEHRRASLSVTKSVGSFNFPSFPQSRGGMAAVLVIISARNDGACFPPTPFVGLVGTYRNTLGSHRCRP